MDMKAIEKVRDGFCEVISKYAETGLRTANDVETAKAALSGMVKIKMLEGMERYEGGYSGRMYRDDGYSERSYSDGNSYRGSYGRGYSGHDIKSQLMDKVREMRDAAHNDEERRMVDDWMRRLEQN